MSGKLEEWNVTLEYDVTVMASDEGDALKRAKAKHRSKGLGSCYNTGVWKTQSSTGTRINTVNAEE